MLGVASVVSYRWRAQPSSRRDEESTPDRDQQRSSLDKPVARPHCDSHHPCLTPREASPFTAMARLRHGWAVRSEPHVHLVSDPPEWRARYFSWDTLTHDPGHTAALVDRFGLDRVVPGSDAPFDMSTRIVPGRCSSHDDAVHGSLRPGQEVLDTAGEVLGLGRAAIPKGACFPGDRLNPSVKQ